MEHMDNDSMRQHALQCAKNFKTSWVDLGRVLYSVWKDKLYKNWGYSTFDAYTSKEINIRKLTALKLLRSYYFLEKEEPEYLKEEYAQSTDAASVPSYEAIDLLRLARNKKALDNAGYNQLKRNIFVKGRDVRDVKKDLTALIKQREELEPDEAWEKKKEGHLKRLLGTLKSIRREMEDSKMLPNAILKEISSLISKIETEVR